MRSIEVDREFEGFIARCDAGSGCQAATWRERPIPASFSRLLLDGRGRHATIHIIPLRTEEIVIDVFPSSGRKDGFVLAFSWMEGRTPMRSRFELDKAALSKLETAEDAWNIRTGDTFGQLRCTVSRSEVRSYLRNVASDLLR